MDEDEQAVKDRIGIVPFWRAAEGPSGKAEAGYVVYQTDLIMTGGAKTVLPFGMTRDDDRTPTHPAQTHPALTNSNEYNLREEVNDFREVSLSLCASKTVPVGLSVSVSLSLCLSVFLSV